MSRMFTAVLFTFLFGIIFSVVSSNAFVISINDKRRHDVFSSNEKKMRIPSEERAAAVITKKPSSTTRLHMDFFKEMIESAFKNDPNLSPDKSQNQLEGPNDVEEQTYMSSSKTDVQKKWLQAQDKTRGSTTVDDGRGAPLNTNLLVGTDWKLALYLMGVPNFDPTNSLYGSKVNISNRDSQLVKDGFAIGADVLPSDPTLTLQIHLLDGGKCKVETSSFTTGADGEWKLSDDGRMVRFCIDCAGYQRIVTTKGTIQNVSWSGRDEAERKSSAVYEIAPGKIYGEARVSYGEKPGVYVMGSKTSPEGLLKMEKAQGLFGISTKMVACGKFAAEMILDGGGGGEGKD